LIFTGSPENITKENISMKKFVAMMVAALMALSFSMVAVAAEKKAFSTISTQKKSAKKDKKEVNKDSKKKEEAKPAKKGKKEMSGC
jgi:sortase (surface protein transpeptidase)